MRQDLYHRIQNGGFRVKLFAVLGANPHLHNVRPLMQAGFCNIEVKNHNSFGNRSLVITARKGPATAETMPQNVFICLDRPMEPEYKHNFTFETSAKLTAKELTKLKRLLQNAATSMRKGLRLV